MVLFALSPALQDLKQIRAGHGREEMSHSASRSGRHLVAKGQAQRDPGIQAEWTGDQVRHRPPRPAPPGAFKNLPVLGLRGEGYERRSWSPFPRRVCGGEMFHLVRVCLEKGRSGGHPRDVGFAGGTVAVRTKVRNSGLKPVKSAYKPTFQAYPPAKDPRLDPT